MPTYRAVILEPTGDVSRVFDFDAFNDREAISRVHDMADGRAAELQQLGRAVAHIPRQPER